MGIQLILFDLDETLLVEYASVDAAFLATCALAEEEHDIAPAKLHPVVLDRARALYHAFPLYPWCHALGLSTWEVLSGDVSGKSPELRVLEQWQPWYRMESWRLGLEAFDVDDLVLVQKLADAFPVQRNKYHKPYPETRDVLTSLEGKYRLGILSNGASKIQRNKLARCGLEGVFDPIIISGEHSLGKPEAGLLRPLPRILKCQADEVVIVGDRLDTDIQMALNVGCKGVWINRRKKRPASNAPKPNATLPDLTKLEATLKKW